MAGTMLFATEPYLPEEPFQMNSVYMEEEEKYTRKLTRKKANAFGNYKGYTRRPYNGMEKPNSSLVNPGSDDFFIPRF